MRTQTIAVEGITYYSEHRKCGRPGCKCAAGELHGPYWYARDAGGKITYIGKTLPNDIYAAHTRLAYARRDIEDARRRLLDQAEALRALSICDSLTKRQRATIEDLGFGYCLVVPVEAGPPQDGLVGPASMADTQDLVGGALPGDHKTGGEYA